MSEIKQNITASSMGYRSKEMLLDGIDAVNHLEAWSELSSYRTPKDNEFMWSPDSDSIVARIRSEILKRDNTHSGSSIAWTMCELEYIAKNGIKKYIQLVESRD